MSLKQVRGRTKDVSTHGVYDRDWVWKRWGASRFALIQSLGAIAPIEKGATVELISFYVTPYDSDVTIRGLIVTNPFRGIVGNKLSSKNGPVSRAEVEAQLGNVDRVVTNLSDGVPIAREGKPFLYQAIDGSERLYYRHKGIDFELKSNVVTSFCIYASEKVNPLSEKAKNAAVKNQP